MGKQFWGKTEGIWVFLSAVTQAKSHRRGRGWRGTRCLPCHPPPVRHRAEERGKKEQNAAKGANGGKEAAGGLEPLARGGGKC